MTCAKATVHGSILTACAYYVEIRWRYRRNEKPSCSLLDLWFDSLRSGKGKSERGGSLSSQPPSYLYLALANPDWYSLRSALDATNICYAFMLSNIEKRSRGDSERVTILKTADESSFPLAIFSEVQNALRYVETDQNLVASRTAYLCCHVLQRDVRCYTYTS